MYAPYLKNSNNDSNQNFGENFCVDFSFGFKFRLFASFLDVLLRFFLVSDTGNQVPGCRLFSRYDMHIHKLLDLSKINNWIRNTNDNNCWNTQICKRKWAWTQAQICTHRNIHTIWYSNIDRHTHTQTHTHTHRIVCPCYW